MPLYAIPTSSDIDDAKKYPTAIWIEQNIALEYKKKESKYFRGKPIAIGSAECKTNISAVLTVMSNLDSSHDNQTRR